jgi:hypothetical protein
VFQCRVDGGPARRKTIWPVGSPWTPATARKEAERLLVQVYQGTDPVEAKREAKREKETLNVRTYSVRFIELYLKPNRRGTWPVQAIAQCRSIVNAACRIYQREAEAASSVERSSITSRAARAGPGFR